MKINSRLNNYIKELNACSEALIIKQSKNTVDSISKLSITIANSTIA